jgi:hypothetical protein
MASAMHDISATPRKIESGAANPPDDRRRDAQVCAGPNPAIRLARRAQGGVTPEKPE